MNSRSLYSILQIADYSEIPLVKKSFRQLALKYHPDRNGEPSAAEKFKEIAKAYEVLSSPQLKREYDIRLKSGVHYQRPAPESSEVSEREMQRRWYAKMRKEHAEMREVENITAYENSLAVMPFVWRIVIIGLLQITGIISIVSDWYQKGSKIALGLLLFVFTTLFLWNELYKHFWHKSLTKDEKKYDRQAYTMFLAVFLTGIFTTVGVIKVKKVWHLHHFGKVIYAGVNPENATLSYTYNEQFYLINEYDIPDELKDKDQVLIRISTKEPEIWEYVEE